MLKQKFLVQFGSAFFLKIIAMLAGIVVARVAGPEVVGIIAYGTAYVSVFGFVNGLFSTGHIKLISEGQDMGKCNTTYAYLQGGSIVLFFFLVSGWFIVQKYLFDYPFDSKTQQIVIIILLFAIIASKLLDFNNVTFTARLEQAKANYPIFVKSIIWQLGRIVIVLLGFKAIGLASLNLIISILVLPLAWRLFRKLPRGKFDKSLSKQYWSYVPPIALIVIVNSVLNYSDKLLLGHFTNVTELGYYSAAFVVGGMFLLVSKATGQIFFPLFSKMITQKDWNGVNQKINTFQDFASIFIFPTICIFVFIGEPFLLAILGQRYQPSVWPFKILLLATYVSIVGMPYGNIISGMGRFYLSATINVIQLIIFVASISFFISPAFLNLGAIGLAFNLLTINLTRNSLYLYFSRRIGEVHLRFIPLIRYLITTSALAIVLLLENYLNLEHAFSVLLFIPGFLIMVYGIFYISGLLNNNQIKQLFEILNIKSIISYIKNEIWPKK